MPPSLGQRLKHAREKLGLTLADVSHRTRIAVPRLSDLEQDSYMAFGSLTYARSFLQSYADFLGVDAHATTEHMPSPPLGGARDYRYLTESYGPWVPDRPDRSLMIPAKSVPAPRSMVALVAGIGMVLALLGGIVVGAVMFGEKKPGTETSSSQRGGTSSGSARDDFEVRKADLEQVPVKKAEPVEEGGHPTVRPPASPNGAPPKALPVLDDPPKKPKR